MTTQPQTFLTAQLREVLGMFPDIRFAVVFGSMARGTETPDSDLDVAVQADRPLTPEQRISITEALALVFNRPIDLIDVRTVGQPLLYQIIAGGIQVLGARHFWGDLIYRSIMENEDFVPYQKRILEGRRREWISN
jgi:predicted nucleotidyltransferase